MVAFGGFGGGGAWGSEIATPTKPPAHYRLNYSGILGPAATPYEIWSIGLAFGRGAGATTQEQADAFLTSAQVAFSNNLSAMICTTARVTKLRLAKVKADGLVDRNADGSYAQRDRIPDVAVVGVSGSICPPSVALAVTLHSAAPGATGRGRIFLPVPTLAGFDGNAGGLSLTAANGFRDAVKGLCVELNAAAGTAGMGRVVVASGGSTVKGIPGDLRLVTSISCGKVLDTMRSRRNALLEGRVLTPLPQSPSDVEMVAFVQDLLRSGASGVHALGSGRGECSSDRLTAPCEVCSASPEVERALDATHSAVALRRAPAGGKT